MDFPFSTVCAAVDVGKHQENVEKYERSNHATMPHIFKVVAWQRHVFFFSSFFSLSALVGSKKQISITFLQRSAAATNRVCFTFTYIHLAFSYRRSSHDFVCMRVGERKKECLCVLCANLRLEGKRSTFHSNSSLNTHNYFVFCFSLLFSLFHHFLFSHS